MTQTHSNRDADEIAQQTESEPLAQTSDDYDDGVALNRSADHTRTQLPYEIRPRPNTERDPWAFERWFDTEWTREKLAIGLDIHHDSADLSKAGKRVHDLEWSEHHQTSSETYTWSDGVDTITALTEAFERSRPGRLTWTVDLTRDAVRQLRRASTPSQKHIPVPDPDDLDWNLPVRRTTYDNPEDPRECPVCKQGGLMSTKEIGLVYRRPSTLYQIVQSDHCPATMFCEKCETLFWFDGESAQQSGVDGFGSDGDFDLAGAM